MEVPGGEKEKREGIKRKREKGKRKKRKQIAF